MYVDGDLRVAVGNQTWTFNPACVSQVPAGILTDLNNTMGHNEREDLQSKNGQIRFVGKLNFWKFKLFPLNNEPQK